MEQAQGPHSRCALLKALYGDWNVLQTRLGVYADRWMVVGMDLSRDWIPLTDMYGDRN